MNTMADGASERLDAQIADALFGQPGMSKMDVANRLLQLRGDGGALLGSAAYPAAWMWPHPEDGSVRFTADGDVATEAANIGRSVAALYRVPVQEDAQPSPAGQVDGLLPCPFCGNGAEFVPYKGNGLTVKCKSMGCIQRHQRTLRYGIEWLRTSMTEHWNARALAARQPVAATDKNPLTVGGAQPVGDGWSGWATQYPGKMPKLYGAREIAEVNHHPDEGQRLIFLSEQPAQAVELGQFREAVEMAMEVPLSNTMRERLQRLLALIDSKAVGK